MTHNDNKDKGPWKDRLRYDFEIQMEHDVTLQRILQIVKRVKSHKQVIKTKLQVMSDHEYFITLSAWTPFEMRFGPEYKALRRRFREIPDVHEVRGLLILDEVTNDED